jgi:uncharacterized protein YcfJ
MNTFIKSAIAVGAMALASQAAAQITFYEREDFQGRAFTTQAPVDYLGDYGFNDRASSVIVTSRRWEICEDPRFGGRCAYVRPGQYPSLASMGLNNRVSSVRMVGRNVDESRYAPPPRAAYDYGRRDSEALFEAPVTSVRAVIGAAEQRCWVEREQVRSGASLPGAIGGALIGGILGHEIGRGGSRDVATVGGAVVGGAVGANIGRSGSYQDVQRCTTVQNQAPSYWDVTYSFRGREHRVQMTNQPGPTVLVNDQGEPRV